VGFARSVESGTAASLSEELEVTMRTVYRDITPLHVHFRHPGL
jgi:predicted DNA-binding transcriptional regulator YafY